jgi:KDO2-lipid IV(A) lauroyltransferase
VLYLFSDFLYSIIYVVLGYRKKVVQENLSNAFPGKSAEEINQITRNYYHHLCDLLVEALKGATMTREQYQQRWTADTEEVLKIQAQNRSVIFILGHFGNWEAAAPVCSFYCKYHLNIVYKPIANSYFEKLVNKIRTRFGNEVTPMDKILRQMLKNKNKPIAYAFVSDQSPSPKNAYWMDFLNQDTAVFTGVEKIAQKLNIPVIYISLQRIKRGYYHVQPTLLFENPKETQEGEIMHAFMKHLEQDIIKDPACWLWSHKRWKHKRNTQA